MIRHELVRILKRWLQHKEDMTQTISSSSTTTQYPSAKAVYDYVQAQIGNAINFINS